MAKRIKTDYIFVHCSATRPSQNVGATDIDRWHRERGFQSIGYHYVICRDGSVEKGRHRDDIGAHVKGYNSNSIGICMVGGVDEEDFRLAENNFTPEQFKTLYILLKDLKTFWPKAKILGHREVDPGKACPSFDVQEWLESRGL